jgi:hypothetical protein
MATNIAWGGFTGTAVGSFLYSPGSNEITNLGLLTTRAILTYDATDSSAPVKVTATAEKTFVTTPTVAAMKTTYGKASYVLLPAISKSFPGFEDAPDWTVITDDANELVGRSYAGKPERISPMSFAVPVVLDLQEILCKHFEYGSSFTLIQCYDDPNEDSLYYVITPRCRLRGVGGADGDNNSGAQSTIQFQPMGGIYVPVYLTEARTTP